MLPGVPALSIRQGSMIRPEPQHRAASEKRYAEPACAVNVD